MTDATRVRKVADLIRDELAQILARGFEEARGALVTIAEVVLTADMSLARVHVSIYPDSADVSSILEALERRRGRLRRDLGRTLRLRRVPDLDFRLDDTARRSQRIEEILRATPPKDAPEDGDG